MTRYTSNAKEHCHQSARENAKANLEYQNCIARGYESDTRNAYGVLNIYCRNRIKKYLKKIVANKKDPALLDLGCGTGNILSIAEGVIKKRIGIDISINMLKEARRYTPDLIVSDAYALPLRDKSIDIIGCTAFIHHIADHERLFKEIYRVLKPGGIFFNDYEPNYYSLKILDKNFLTRSLIKVHHYLGDKILEAVSKNNPPDELIKKADLYGSCGIKPDLLVEKLYKAGFQEAHYICHSDSHDFEKPKEGRRLHRIYEFLIKVIGHETEYDRQTKLFSLFAEKKYDS